MNKSNVAPLTGVDGCKAGWIAVTQKPLEELQAKVFSRFCDLRQFVGEEAIIAVDMPIGLPDVIGPGGRGPEKAIRPVLGRLKNCVFSIPSRMAVYSELSASLPMPEKLVAHQRASAIARKTSSPPKGVSIQAFGIFPKIREIDEIIAPQYQHLLRETHPELVFWRLNGCKALNTRKKGMEGRKQRRQLLISGGISSEFLDRSPPKGAAADDLLDACACLMTARRLADGTAVPHPAIPHFDSRGLQMAIWA